MEALVHTLYYSLKDAGVEPLILMWVPYFIIISPLCGLCGLFIYMHWRAR